ncbi:hypothetical protein ABT009_30480 [Streptomyces sp. NPDC002896]|uniref:hypothetical protein n=1 Tax=Streptomyces sp. NPDC002896 TaxID=3154438 RepID=UPI003328C116
MSIIHAFLTWVMGAFGPRPCGRHRADRTPAPPLLAPPARPSSPRSGYGLEGPLNGEETALVRPYLVAHEQRQERARQHQRRLALVLAADFGIDLDRHVIGARGAA